MLPKQEKVSRGQLRQKHSLMLIFTTYIRRPASAIAPIAGESTDSRPSFNLREQVGKLVVSELAVFPADFDAEPVLRDHFAVHPIWGPDNDFMDLESLCFLSIHGGLSMSQMEMIIFRSPRGYDVEMTIEQVRQHADPSAAFGCLICLFAPVPIISY
jgi:hypothetical protein